MEENLKQALSNLINKAYNEGVNDSYYNENSGLKVESTMKSIAKWPEVIAVIKIIENGYEAKPNVPKVNTGPKRGRPRTKGVTPQSANDKLTLMIDALTNKIRLT